MSTHVVLWFEEPQLARMISCRLMRADFEVHSVHDDQSACEILDRIQPQLLITDWQPSRAGLLQKAHEGDIPVIGLTPNGRTMTDINDLCRRGLIAAVLSLPCSIRRLIELARHITQHEPCCALVTH